MSEGPMVPLAAIVTIVTEKATVNKDPTKPYVGLEHIPSSGSKLVGMASARESISTNNVFQSGDILFGKLRPGLRKSIRAHFDGYCSTDILVLRPNSEVDPEFASFVLQSGPVFREAVRTEEGTKMPRCSWQSLKDLHVYLPSITQQHSIADILSTLDETIEQTDALNAKHQQIKAGLMHDLFTRGVTPDGHLRPTREQAPQLYNESSLGWIPKEWTEVALGDLFSRRVERGRAGLPIMSITMSGGLIERDSVERRIDTNLPPEGHLLVRKDDIAYNMMRMWQGVLGRGKYDCLVSPAYVVLKPTEDIDSTFAEHLFSTETAATKFKQLSYGVVDDRLRLYFRDFTRIRFAIPQNVNEQKVISEKLGQIDAFLQHTGAAVERLRQLKHGLMHDLLTGHVRVKLDAASCLCFSANRLYWQKNNSSGIWTTSRNISVHPVAMLA